MSDAGTGDGRDRTPSERVDVCVVGAGVAGGLVAHSLAERGYSVVLLEAGERFDLDADARFERRGRELDDAYDRPDVWGTDDERDRYSTVGGVDYPLNELRVKGVGGTTLQWLGIAPRLHEKDFEMASRYGVADDWPIGFEDLRPYYVEAERELGVAGADDNPFTPPREHDYPMAPFPETYSDGLYEEAGDRLGIAVHTAPQARNSEPYDGRNSCAGYSTCTPACPSGAKYSGHVHVRKARAAGARVIDRAPVQRLEHDADRVTAARYATPSGAVHEQCARRFVLACGGVETARLLLLSRSTEYPDGLANSSGLVGRYFMEHPFVVTLATLDRPGVQDQLGFFTRFSHEFYEHDEPPPGSVQLEFYNVWPRLPENDPGAFEERLAATDWDDGVPEILRTDVDRVGLRIGGLVEMLPRADNRVTLDPSRTDDRGNPVPNVTLNVGEYGRETIRHAHRVQRRIVAELGAEDVTQKGLSPPIWIGHHMGTTRMGEDPAESVVNPHLRTHDLENLYVASSSAFVTGGATNPTLTIAALSLRVADRVASTL